jgi:hypothetical protein
MIVETIDDTGAGPSNSEQPLRVEGLFLDSYQHASIGGAFP